jgi:MFS family permease
VIGIYNLVGPIFNLIFIVFFLDRVGRRKPLIFGTIAISIALVCEAALGSQVTNATGSKKDGISGAGVFFLFLVSCIFSVSFGPISWVYASEIMPLSIRGRGSAFSTAVGNWYVTLMYELRLRHILNSYTTVKACWYDLESGVTHCIGRNHI